MACVTAYWDSIQEKVINSLVGSMLTRALDVLELQGKQIDY